MTAKIDHKKDSSRLQAAGIIKNLKIRGMDGIFCETSAQAVEEICRMIPAGSLVGLGGSETIMEIGPGRRPAPHGHPPAGPVQRRRQQG